MSFWQGQFPLIFGNKDDRVALPSSFKPSSIGYLMIVVGSGEVTGACQPGLAATAAACRLAACSRLLPLPLPLSSFASAGSLAFGRLSDRYGRWPVMLTGLGLIALCFFAIYALMLVQVRRRLRSVCCGPARLRPRPANLKRAPLQIVEPTPAMALAIGFVLGVIDSIINTQLFAILGAS